jgi:hypothetical protein
MRNRTRRSNIFSKEAVLKRYRPPCYCNCESTAHKNTRMGGSIVSFARALLHEKPNEEQADSIIEIADDYNEHVRVVLLGWRLHYPPKYIRRLIGNKNYKTSKKMLRGIPEKYSRAVRSLHSYNEQFLLDSGVYGDKKTSYARPARNAGTDTLDSVVDDNIWAFAKMLADLEEAAAGSARLSY